MFVSVVVPIAAPAAAGTAAAAVAGGGAVAAAVSVVVRLKTDLSKVIKRKKRTKHTIRAQTTVPLFGPFLAVM